MDKYLGSITDKNGYPTDSCLEYIANYNIYKGYDELIELLQDIFERYGKVIIDGNRMTLITGGWSGCEDAIRALEDNTLFWTVCWQKTERGGLDEFELKEVKYV